MSRSQRLQRLTVRMLYDEGFRERVLAGSEPVDAADRSLLLAIDSRAFSTDPYRQGRTLSAILAELPVTGALLGARAALEFFRSASFHAAIEGRGSLVLGFGRWASSTTGPLGMLELAMATLRRARDPVPTTGTIALGGRFHPFELPAGALAAFEALRGSLGPLPLEVLAARPDPLPLPSFGTEKEHLLLERSPAGEVAISLMTPLLFELVAASLAGPRARTEIVAHLRALGAGDDAEEVLGDLVADGVLVTAP